MFQALANLRRWPKQIESDLKFRGIHIADWHRGTLDEHGIPKLSSRLLLVLLEGLEPETSAFKRSAERDGDWTATQKMIQQIANEISQLRASYHAVARHHDYEPSIWLSPSEVRDMQEEEEDNSLLRDEVLNDLAFGLM